MYGFFSTIYTDSKGKLRNIWISGCVLCYIAVIFNITILSVLRRRNLSSPATVLMQGLAIADALTSFCSYGFEFLFQLKYENYIHEIRKLTLSYPYCAMYVHMSLLTEMFHLVSTALTLSIGIQKCVAMRFPIWTRIYLTKRKSLAVCLISFIVCIIIHVPRNLTLIVKAHEERDGYCVTTYRNEQLLDYSSLYFTMINTVLLTGFCVVMLLSTIYIVYKFITTSNLRHKRVSKRTRQSALLVVFIMIIYLIIEIPKVLMYIVFASKSLVEFDKPNNIFYSLWVIENNKNAMTAILAYGTNIFNDIFPVAIERWEFLLFLNEGRKIFTLLGCMSNFVIYISMSSKIRKELKLMFKNSLRSISTLQRRHTGIFYV